jgi:site-specific recombinase XerD
VPKKYAFEKKVIIDGTRYTFRADTQEELAVKIALKRRDIEEGKVLITGSMTVKQWTKVCLGTYKSNVKPETLAVMTYRINKHIIPQIGMLPVRAVKPIQCQQILNQCAGMSYSHIRSLSQELNFIFEKAKENHLILENPAEHLVRPACVKGERRAITDHERKHLLAVADKDPAFNLFLLMLYCGCRPGEAIKCQGSDIRIVNNYAMLHIRGTKTKNSDRVVPIPEDLLRRIEGTPPFDPLSPNAYGRFHSESSYKRLAERLRRELNISMGCRVYRNQLVSPFPLAEDFVPYDLRHTYCTDLQKAGVDVRTAQKLMGHADIQTTANIYTHVDDSLIADAAEKLNCPLHDLTVPTRKNGTE